MRDRAERSAHTGAAMKTVHYTAALIAAQEPSAAKRGPYKKKAA